MKRIICGVLLFLSAIVHGQQNRMLTWIPDVQDTLSRQWVYHPEPVLFIHGNNANDSSWDDSDIPSLIDRFNIYDLPNAAVPLTGRFTNTSVAVVGTYRKEHRVTEDQFIRMASESSAVVLDARSTEKYAKLHIKGSKHLSLPDITEEELAKVIPTKATTVLIYCNNNFLNAREAFSSKMAKASLNIHTFNVLFNYGYTNVYELGPLIDINKMKLPIEGTLRPNK